MIGRLIAGGDNSLRKLQGSSLFGDFEASVATVWDQ